MVFDPARPFLFFENARGEATGHLFAGAEEWLDAWTLAEVPGVLNRAQAALAKGRWVAGYLGYEAAGAFEPRMASPPGKGRPLVRFGVFAPPAPFGWREAEAMLGRRSAAVRDLRPDIAESDHRTAVSKVLGYIAAGDIYQANLTFRANGRIEGHPLALYGRLRRAQLMGEGALMHEPEGGWLLSASPELFFRIDAGTVTSRPMKGTARRRGGWRADLAAAEALARDAKNRAENLMITDLIRNDLSRIAAPGSVRVQDPFAVETYPTVHQMVTTVKADLRVGLAPLDVVRAMFPCGSITGAPKVRAGEIIRETERSPRGIYTGSLGWMSPEGDARFNVAIRTAEISSGALRLGIGSGIVADSDPADEWRECLSKAAFLEAEARPFHLIETMRFDPAEGLCLLEHHMRRLRRSASYFGFEIDIHSIANMLQAVTGRLRDARKVRLAAGRTGAYGISIHEPPRPAREVTVSLAPLPVDPDDPRLYHKTSLREFYDEAREVAPSDEIIFVRGDGQLTEGSRTNLFVERGGKLLTPPESAGLLPGTLRAHLIEEGRAEEAALTADDLEGGRIYMGNALRGLVPARLVAPRQSLS